MIEETKSLKGVETNGTKNMVLEDKKSDQSKTIKKGKEYLNIVLLNYFDKLVLSVF